MRNRWFSSGVCLAAGVVAATSFGCRKPKVPRPRPPIKIAVEGEAASTINRDVNGDPNSVVVRLYHLKGRSEFSKLTFDLVNSGRTDQELLGGDLLGRSEFVVVPGTTTRETAEISPGTTYLGVVAFFRKPDPNYWRYLLGHEQLDAARTRKKDWEGRRLPLFSFKVEDCFLTLNYAKPELIPGQPLNAKPECGGSLSFAPAKPPEAVPVKTRSAKPVKPALPPKPPIPVP